MKKGDLVTVALRERSSGLLSRTEVYHTGLMGFMATDDDRNVHYLVDEGITWVRGHVADDSPEGRALIAAHALAPKTAWFTTVGMLPMTGGTWMPVGGNSHGGPTVSAGTLIAAKPNPKNELGE